MSSTSATSISGLREDEDGGETWFGEDEGGRLGRSGSLEFASPSLSLVRCVMMSSIGAVGARQGSEAASRILMVILLGVLSCVRSICSLEAGSI